MESVKVTSDRIDRQDIEEGDYRQIQSEFKFRHAGLQKRKILSREK